jgi:hypothetical protein
MSLEEVAMRTGILIMVIIALVSALVFRYDLMIDIRNGSDRYVVAVQPSTTGWLDIAASHEAASNRSSPPVKGGSGAHIAVEQELASR